MPYFSSVRNTELTLCQNTEDVMWISSSLLKILFVVSFVYVLVFLYSWCMLLSVSLFVCVICVCFLFSITFLSVLQLVRIKILYNSCKMIVVFIDLHL